MSDRLGRKLLREYIRQAVLNEEISGLSGSGGWYWLPAYTGPMTGLWQPFVDVGRTAVAGVIDMTSRVWGLVKSTLALATSSVIPFASGNFEKINKQTHERTRAIMNEFSDVFDRTDRALQHNDLHAIAFMMNPGMYILSKLKPSPDMLSKMQSKYEHDRAEARQYRNEQMSKLKKLYAALTAGPLAARAAGESDIMQHLQQAAEAMQGNDRMLLEISKDEMLDAIAKSSITRAMQQAARRLVTDRVGMIVRAANALDGVQNLQQLQQLLGKDLDLSKFDDLDDSAESSAAKEIIDTARSELKKLYRSTLESEMKRVQQSGARSLASIYHGGIAQIGKS